MKILRLNNLYLKKLNNLRFKYWQKKIMLLLKNLHQVYFLPLLQTTILIEDTYHLHQLNNCIQHTLLQLSVYNLWPRLTIIKQLKVNFSKSIMNIIAKIYYINLKCSPNKMKYFHFNQKLLFQSESNKKYQIHGEVYPQLLSWQ